MLLFASYPSSIQYRTDFVQVSRALPLNTTGKSKLTICSELRKASIILCLSQIQTWTCITMACLEPEFFQALKGF